VWNWIWYASIELSLAETRLHRVKKAPRGWILDVLPAESQDVDGNPSLTHYFTSQLVYAIMLVTSHHHNNLPIDQR
jgi:hypothetical protein